MKMETHSSETSVLTGSTQYHIPEDSILHSHYCENLKSYNMTVVLLPPYFSVSSIEDKTERRQFYTAEVIKAESQVVLNTLTEHDFQDAFKEMAEALGTVHTCGRGLFRG
jgi:hypothetical protein